MESRRKRSTVNRLPPLRPRRTQAQRRAETRRKLIGAAIDVLRESGFSQLTIGEVAARAGVTSGAVQHHFPFSEDMLQGVIEALFPMLDIQVCEPDMPGLEVSERIGRIVDVYWQRLYDRPDYLVACELMIGTRGQDSLQKLLKALQKRMVSKAVSDLMKAFADTGMRPDAAFQLWTFIGSQLRGLALLSMFEGTRVLKDDLSLLKKAVAQLIIH